MSSEMLLADKYLSIINKKLVEVSGERGELKGSCPVRWRAVGNTDYAVRWPPTQLIYPPSWSAGCLARRGGGCCYQWWRCWLVPAITHLPKTPLSYLFP